MSDENDIKGDEAEPMFSHVMYLKPSKAQHKELSRRFYLRNRLHNQATADFLQRMDFLMKSKPYREVMVARKGVYRDVEHITKKLKGYKLGSKLDKTALKSLTKEEQTQLKAAEAKMKDLSAAFKSMTEAPSLAGFRGSVAGNKYGPKDVGFWQATANKHYKMLGQQVSNIIIADAWGGAQRYLYSRGKARRAFLRWDDTPSIQGNQHLRVVGKPGKLKLVWGKGFEIPIANQNTKHFYHAFERAKRNKKGDIDTVTIVKSLDRFEIRLICKGEPLPRVQSPVGSVGGYDLNVSGVGYHTEEGVGFISLAENTKNHSKLSELQRAVSRKTWASFTEEDRIKLRKGVTKQAWGRAIRNRPIKRDSKALTKSKLKENRLHRAYRAYSDQTTNKVAKKLASQAEVWYTENVSPKTWMKSWGKRMASTKPGSLVSELKKMVDVKKFSTYDTFLSQMCVCGKREKKNLGQRTHSCECGVSVPRDVMSGFLARYCASGKLDLAEAQKNKNLLTVEIK